MKKQEIRVTVDYDLDWEDTIEISKLKEDLAAIEKLGATHIDIEVCDGYGFTIQAIAARLETDEECEVRLDITREYDKRRKESELKQLAELKAKYPD